MIVVNGGRNFEGNGIQEKIHKDAVGYVTGRNSGVYVCRKLPTHIFKR